MITLRFDQLATMVDGTIYNIPPATQTFSGVSIDSRTTQPGQLFIAIRGERVDSHQFVPQAIENGATAVLCEFHYPGIVTGNKNVCIIAVKDTHEAMKTLARKYRGMCTGRIVGITGSNGKTTTKEMTYALLKAVDRDVYRSAGNLNNLYGIPLAIFAMPQVTRVAVMEMGISQPGEMTQLTQIVRPDVAVITNIGATHLEFLGSLEGVARAKLEMVATSDPDMPVIINADDPILTKEIKRYRETFITFGMTHSATFEPEKVERDASGVALVTIEGHRFRLPLFGEHQIYNLLAGYAVARTLGYSFDNVDTESIQLTTAPMRGETITHNGVLFIVDCYNANPESMRLGLKSFQSYKTGGRRIIVLGDMLELGARAREYHEEVGEQLAGMKFDLAIGVGPLAESIIEKAVSGGVSWQKLRHFDDVKTASDELKGLIRPGDTVYIKGSRGIGLEQILSDYRKVEVTR